MTEAYQSHCCREAPRPTNLPRMRVPIPHLARALGRDHLLVREGVPTRPIRAEDASGLAFWDWRVPAERVHGERCPWVTPSIQESVTVSARSANEKGTHRGLHGSRARLADFRRLSSAAASAAAAAPSAPFPSLRARSRARCRAWAAALAAAGRFRMASVEGAIRDALQSGQNHTPLGTACRGLREGEVSAWWTGTVSSC